MDRSRLLEFTKKRDRNSAINISLKCEYRERIDVVKKFGFLFQQLSVTYFLLQNNRIDNYRPKEPFKTSTSKLPARNMLPVLKLLIMTIAGAKILGSIS
jgi:hypothetical protein